MLKMRFKTGQVSWPERRMSIDPPYQDVASFIYSESGAVAGTTRTIEQLRAVIDGKHPPIECETGNSWTMDVDSEWTTLTNDYGTERRRVRLPTARLLDALELWRAHLLAAGADPDV